MRPARTTATRSGFLPANDTALLSVRKSVPMTTGSGARGKGVRDMHVRLSRATTRPVYSPAPPNRGCISVEEESAHMAREQDGAAQASGTTSQEETLPDGSGGVI